MPSPRPRSRSTICWLGRGRSTRGSPSRRSGPRMPASRTRTGATSPTGPTRMTTRSEVASGLLVIDKPSGWTSHQVVARVRRLLGTRKVGHAGTLDPMATGVLLVGVNRATRLLGQLTLTAKAYDATVRLGASTTPDDAEGETLTSASVEHVTEDDGRSAAGAFIGDLAHKPSAVSAIKVDGKRAYARVR